MSRVPARWSVLWRKLGRRAPWTAACILASWLPARSAAAQVLRDSSTSWLASVGSEGERYLRTLQVAALAPPAHWSLRPFSGHELRRLLPADSGHPWARQFAVPPRRQVWVRFIQPELTGIYNSGFPYGMHDGPVWAGRGPTITALAGMEGAVGPLEFTVAPQLFRAENWSFAIAPNGMTGPQAFGDALRPDRIDLPQRFGDGPYQRFDPGQSTVRLRLLGTMVGVSTANEAWGPATDSPFLLGSNAAGFPHFFVGTDGSLALGPLRTSVRLIAGRLDQSPYAPSSLSSRRYLTGAIVVLGVRQVPGLEVGLARLFHNATPDTGVSVSDILTQLLKNPFKARLSAQLGADGTEPDNQLAAAFMRWNVPGAGLELYGELGREDNAYDLRDFLVEPDRDVSYSLGMQRVWRRSDGSLFALRGEILSSAASHLARARQPEPPYVHTPITQGHTQLGQVLGAPGGYGGGAGMVAVEWVTTTGRRTITWRRVLAEPVMLPAPRNVVHAVTFDWLLFRPRIDLSPEATLAYGLNRVAVGDALNLRAALTGRMHW